MSRRFPLLVLPENVLSLEGETFFQLVRKACGDAFKDLMEVLCIDSVYKLLLAEKDILSVFQKNYRELEKISQKACLHLDDGTILVKPGLLLDFNRFIDSLHAVRDRSNDAQAESKTIANNICSLLKILITKNQSIDHSDSQTGYSFLIALVDNVVNNLLKNKNNYRYSEGVLNFAQALFILGGRNVYEFIRLNLPGAIPALSTLTASLEKDGTEIEEARFRYDSLGHHQNLYEYQIAVCSEDSTAVVQKVAYNSATDTFTGFSTPLDDGIPISHYYQTDSFDQLKHWFENNEKSTCLNVHMIQPLIESIPYLPPFILASYGISNTFTAIDVLNRWLWILEKSRQSHVRVVAFSTDCDPRYLLAMRLGTGFFAKFANTRCTIQNDDLRFELPHEWSNWYFMKTSQSFLCFQDPIHLCTKLRNRMLSTAASMLIGREQVSIDVLNILIQTKSKLVHGLVKTDIQPKDRQNFKSCFKLANDTVIEGLDDIRGSRATQVYLKLLRSIVLAYVERNTSIFDRLYNGWFAVFLCRIWQTWLSLVKREDILKKLSKTRKEELFITTPAHFSIEINAHSMLSLCLLVIQHKLPEAALSIWNYNSQSCEATFRLTRSMSGAFSSIVNFSTEQFLKRAAKLSVLNDLETRSDFGLLSCSLEFPKHHKRRRNGGSMTRSLPNRSSTNLSLDIIKETIDRAFDDAYNLLSQLGIKTTLEKNDKNTIKDIGSFIRAQFEAKTKVVSIDGSTNCTSDDHDELSFDSNSQYDANISQNLQDSSSSEDESDEISSLSAHNKSHFRGMRIIDSVPSSQINHYFSIEIDGQKKYIHKQTACWLLMDQKPVQSSDRLKRVQQSN